MLRLLLGLGSLAILALHLWRIRVTLVQTAASLPDSRILSILGSVLLKLQGCLFTYLTPLATYLEPLLVSFREQLQQLQLT
jgi:hypothetical protein